METKTFKLEKLPSWVLPQEIFYSYYAEEYGCNCLFCDHGDDGYASSCNLPHSPKIQAKIDDLYKKISGYPHTDWKVLRDNIEYQQLQKESEELESQCPLLEEDEK